MKTPSFQILMNEYLSGLTLKELGNKYNVDKSTIRWKLVYYGFNDFRRIYKGNNGLKGKKLSNEHKLNISKSKKGNKNTQWKGGKIEFVCEYCGKKFERYLYGRKTVRFCSNECSSNVLKGKNNGMFGKRGNKHPQWKEKTKKDLTHFLRHCADYKEWRLMVFGRDNFTCQKCGKRGSYLEAHHIKSLSNIIEEYKIKAYDDAKKCKILWNIDNGITYCIKCHIKEDKMRARFTIKKQREGDVRW